MVTVNDVIAIEGPRVPNRQNAPQVFRQGYILLARRGELPSQQNLDKAETFRAGWPGYFVDRTDGRGIMQTQLGAELPVAVVQGNITSAVNGSTVKNFMARLLEKNYIQPVPDGGYYAFRVLGDAVGAPPQQATIVVTAFPFLPDTSRVTLTFGSTVSNSRALRPLLATSALRGTLQGADNKPVSAKVTLFASSNAAPPFQLTATTDAQGRYAFENLTVSTGAFLRYDSLRFEPDVPYLSTTVTAGLAVVATAPTIVNATLAIADVLLVNDDPAGAFANFYTSALNSLNLKPYLWVQRDRGVATISALPRFNKKLLIWYTGNATGASVLTAAEQDSISAVLDRGGCIFLTGQNIAESLRGTTFLANRLHVSYVRNNPLDFRLHGVRNDPVGQGLVTILITGSGGANNQTSQDVLEPVGLARASVVFDTTTGIVAGVRVEDAANNSRLVFFGFGFEAVNPGPTPQPGFATREAVMRNVTNYLSGKTAVAARDDNADGLPATYSLGPNYPNPFNEQTEIEYQIAYVRNEKAGSRQQVTLKIYDLLGRAVQTLVDAPQAAGAHRIQWDGRNTAGERVVNGVYFYQLEAGSFRQVRKLVYVR